jgi:Fe-S cluster assembly ATP-binding protein
MSKLVVRDLKAGVTGRQILHGVQLEVNSGEVHVVMGPNGSGKSTLSHILMGKPGYIEIEGSVELDGEELLDKPTFERANKGLFLAMQYPVEIPGVSLEDTLREAQLARVGHTDNLRATMETEAARIGFDERFLERPLNVDLSGGEKKRNETLMMAVLQPKFAILDEIDSGLDIDALRAVARRVEAETKENNLGVLAITHYARLLNELKPDVIHILVNGRIVDSGGPELAEELETTGYARYGATDEIAGDEFVPKPTARPQIVDPWGGDPLKGR